MPCQQACLHVGDQPQRNLLFEQSMLDLILLAMLISAQDRPSPGLVEVDGPTTPWFPGGLVADLEEALGRRVDVVEPDAIRQPLRQRILREAVPL